MQFHESTVISESRVNEKRRVKKRVWDIKNLMAQNQMEIRIKGAGSIIRSKARWRRTDAMNQI